MPSNVTSGLKTWQNGTYRMLGCLFGESSSHHLKTIIYSHYLIRLKLHIPPSSDGISDTNIIIRENALEAGVLALPGIAASPTGTKGPFCRISFSLLKDGEANEACRRLATVVREAVASHRRSNVWTFVRGHIEYILIFSYLIEYTGFHLETPALIFVSSYHLYKYGTWWYRAASNRRCNNLRACVSIREENSMSYRFDVYAGGQRFRSRSTYSMYQVFDSFRDGLVLVPPSGPNIT